MKTEDISIRKKLIITGVFGLAALVVNLFPVTLFVYQGSPIFLQLGSLFPLFIALAWGFKYGMIAAVGAVVPLFFTMGQNGYGFFFVLLSLLTWIAWHGWFADLRSKKGPAKWYFNANIVETVFRILHTVGYIFIYPWLVSMNPPFWNPEMAVNAGVGLEASALILVLYIVQSYLYVALADLPLSFDSVRTRLGIKRKAHNIRWVIPIALAVALVLVVFDVLEHIVFHTDVEYGFFVSMMDTAPQHMIFRLLMIATCLVSGIMIYVIWDRDLRKKQSLMQSAAQIEQQNDELLASRDALADSRAVLKTYLDKAPYAIFEMDESCAINECNAKASDITGYRRDELLGRRICDFIAADERTLVTERLAVMKDQKLGFVIDVKTRFISRSGMLRDWAVKLTRMPEGRLLVYAEDITDKEVYRRRLEYLSKYDALTGVYNKSYLNIYMDNLVRQKKNLPVSMIYADINGMRRMNEQFGYRYGDKVIRNMAGALSGFFEGTGVVFRMGGNSFVIAIPATSSIKCSKSLGNVLKEIKAAQNGEVSYTTAMGSAAFGKGVESWRDALRQAENQMYASKIIQEDSPRSVVMSSFMMALSERSSETEEHVRRMKNLSGSIAEALGLGRDQIDNVLMTAQLHDIGKMGIPDSILKKPGRLDKDEWTIMKTHCEIGYRIVSAAAEMNDIAEFVRAHHERWDGGGYPEGLKGEAIPIAARIVAVADAFDAMTNERVYKKEQPNEMAIDEIKRCSGSQFDPGVVKAFVKVMETGAAE